MSLARGNLLVSAYIIDVFVVLFTSNALYIKRVRYGSKDLQLPLPHISQPYNNFGLSWQSNSSNMWEADADGCLSVCRSKTDCD